jgi:hypothetical protein
LAVARAAKGFMPDDEGLALHRMGARAAASGLGPLLEVGTYCAKSAVYLGAAARLVSEGRVAEGAVSEGRVSEGRVSEGRVSEGRLAEGRLAEGRVSVWSVDHHRGSEENQAGWEHHDPDLVDRVSGRMDTLPWARRTLEAADLEAIVMLAVGPSTVIASTWSTPLSLLFIDGGHGHDVAWADYRAWASKVAIGGWLAIHDVFPDPVDGGRPPYELYLDALNSGCWQEDAAAGCGSLRVLQRIPSKAST